MKKITTITLAVLLALTLASSVLAFNGGFGRGRGGGPCYGGDTTGFSGLNLSSDQEVKVRNLREAHGKDIQPLQEKMYGKRGEMKLLWLQKNPDEGKIMAAHKEIQALRDKMQEKMISYRLAMFKILTPEQQTKLQATYGGRGFGPGPGPGFGCDGPGSRGHRGPGWGMRGN